MNNTIKVECDLAGVPLVFETGLLAQQAHGAVTVQLADTILFSAVTVTSEPRKGIDFFPMQVEYREKFYAAGRFPGGYFKREAKPSEKEVITARVTDRPLRTLFPEGYYNDVQINNMLLSADTEYETDVLSINAASAALTISEIPLLKTIGAVRIGRINGELIVNPTQSQLAESDLNLVYVGSEDLPLMIEGSAKEIKEADMLAAMKLAHESIQPIIRAQYELRSKLGLGEKVIPHNPVPAELMQKLRERGGAELEGLLDINDKKERDTKVGELKQRLKDQLLEEDPDLADEVFRRGFDEFEIGIVRSLVLDKGKRIGGRAFDELRSLSAQVGILPRAHGSALFNRGETQTLGIVTLGPTSDAQEMDALTGGPDQKMFYLHYNFPPYSVGEVGRLGATNRREIGHGNLAERGLRQVMPDNYPYTVRLVAEVMGSNGSSSMASATAGTLALMDAGIPIKRPVAGISIGLFTGENKAQLVTDILGAEDHCGDMDFKVTGTREGITAFQVDLKIHGLPWDLVEGAFNMARDARLKILDYMQTIISESRPELSCYAPRIRVLKIPTDKIGMLIGPGGKNIKRITDTWNVQIDIEDDGTVNVFSTDKQAMDGAAAEVELISAEAEVGKIYRGKVTGAKEFGAFVEILPGKEGLVHISEMANFRVRDVEDICKIGDSMWVKCIGLEENGKIRLSRKAALDEKDQEARGDNDGDDSGQDKDRHDEGHRQDDDRRHDQRNDDCRRDGGRDSGRRRRRR